MNAAVHANISARKYKTEDKSDWDFFYKLHDFMDCSKEICATQLLTGRPSISKAEKLRFPLEVGIKI